FTAADIYVSASHIDGSSVTLLEAMASGLPAITSDIPGNAEWVEPGTSGVMFPDGDASALAQALTDLAPDSERMAAMGRRGRAIVEARADWARNRSRLFAAYDLARARSAPAP